MRIPAFIMILAGLLANTAFAGDACKPPAACTEVQTCGGENHCCRCGRSCACEKHCKIVCEMKEVKKTVWKVKCGEFCPLLPNCPCSCGKCDSCCGQCSKDAECDCNNCSKHDPCAAEKKKCFVPPKCGKPREVKTLEKKEVVCKVPSYKCVVSYVCPQCSSEGCGGEKAEAAASSNQAPAPVPEKTTQEAPLPPVMGVSFVHE